MQDHELYFHLAYNVQSGSVAVATVIHVQGSVPREVGAKMLVWESDAGPQIIGTIGGGAGEAKVIQTAQIVLITGEPQKVDIDLTGAKNRETQGVCGGKMQVWVAKWAGKPALHLAEQIHNQLVQGKHGFLYTPLFAQAQPYLVDDLANAAANEPAHRAKVQRQPVKPVHTGTQPQIIDNIFVESLCQLPVLLIIGAGHVGIALAKMASRLGFQVMVQDDRPEFVDKSRFPKTIFASTVSLAELLHQLRLRSSSLHIYIVLVTRSYQHDVAALATLFAETSLHYRYIGSIGSQKRIEQVFRQLKSLGISPNQLQSIHAPIGLDIGALTPEEIAVSISAELIKVRQGGTGLSLSKL